MTKAMNYNTVSPHIHEIACALMASTCRSSCGPMKPLPSVSKRWNAAFMRSSRSSLLWWMVAARNSYEQQVNMWQWPVHSQEHARAAHNLPQEAATRLVLRAYCANIKVPTLRPTAAKAVPMVLLCFTGPHCAGTSYSRVPSPSWSISCKGQHRRGGVGGCVTQNSCAGTTRTTSAAAAGGQREGEEGV